MSKNLIKQQNEVTIYSDGQAYISQRKLAELLGVNQSSIQRLCASRNIDVKQGLSVDSTDLCIIHYALEARKTTDQARALAKKIMKAGTKAYLYHLAGYEMVATKREPLKATNLKDKVLLPAYEYEAQLRIEHLERENKLRMEYLERESKIKTEHLEREYAMKDSLLDKQELEEIKLIEARRDKILIEENLTAHADMKASKVLLPVDTITNLLRENKTGLKPVVVNRVLLKLGILELNNHKGGTYQVSDAGKIYGRNIKIGNTYHPRWFISTFDKLLIEIENA